MGLGTRRRGHGGADRARPHTDEWARRSWQDIVFNWLVYVLGVWMMIVGLLGLFHRVANRTNRVYAYATEAAYPFYILHQTAIVLLAYFVVRWGIGIPLEFTVIAVAAFLASVAVYEVAGEALGPDALPLWDETPAEALDGVGT